LNIFSLARSPGAGGKMMIGRDSFGIGFVLPDAFM